MDSSVGFDVQEKTGADRELSLVSILSRWVACTLRCGMGTHFRLRCRPVIEHDESARRGTQASGLGHASNSLRGNRRAGNFEPLGCTLCRALVSFEEPRAACRPVWLEALMLAVWERRCQRQSMRIASDG
jgi:hypothetical protein